MSAKGDTMMRNTVAHMPYVLKTLQALEHVPQLVPLDWWVKGDDSAAYFPEPVAAQVKLQVDSYIGHDMSVDECLPRERLGEAELIVTDGLVGRRPLRRRIGNLPTRSPQTSDLSLNNLYPKPST